MACGSNDVELVKDKIHALLGTHLATLFLQNKLSAHETQHLATMAHWAGVLLAQKLHEAYGTLHTSLVLQLAQVLMKIYQCMDECWDNDMGSKLSMMMGCIYVEHPTLLPHEVIHYLVASGRHDQNLGSKKKALCDKHLLDDKVCIALGFHGDGVPFQKSTHKLLVQQGWQALHVL